MSNETLQDSQAAYELTEKEEKLARKLAGRVIKAATKGKPTARVPLLNPVRGHLLYEQARTVYGTGHAEEIFDRTRGLLSDSDAGLDFDTVRTEPGRVRLVPAESKEVKAA